MISSASIGVAVSVAERGRSIVNISLVMTGNEVADRFRPTLFVQARVHLAISGCTFDHAGAQSPHPESKTTVGEPLPMQ
jgi:hypothetical protein